MVQFRYIFPKDRRIFNFRETKFVPGFRVEEAVDEYQASASHRMAQSDNTWLMSSR